MDSGKNSDNDFSMDPKPPQSDIDPGQTKVARKTLLALRAGCPPPPLLLLPFLGPRSPFPAPWDSMGPGRAAVMSREWEMSGGSGACVCSRHPTCSLCITIVPSVLYGQSRMLPIALSSKLFQLFLYVVGMDTNT